MSVSGRWAVPIIAVFAVVFSSIGVGAVQAQQGESTEDDIQVLSSEVDDNGVVELIVAVPARFGEVAAIASNFAVTENQSTRPVQVMPLDDDVDVWLVIDTSGSMRGEPLAAATSAAQAFLAELPADARVGVIGFGASPAKASPLSAPREETAAAINALTATGETALYDALELAVADVVPRPGAQTYLVVLSDGGDTASTTTLESAISQLQASRIGLYAVALTTSESDPAAIASIVEATNGQLATTDDLTTLNNVYTEIAGRLTNRYVLRFESSGVGEQRVVVSVASDGAVATATAIVDTGQTATAIDDLPRNLRGAEPATLQQIVVPEPGLLGRNAALWAGTVAIFGALAMLLLVIFYPSARARLDTPSTGLTDVGGRLEGAADRLVAKSDRGGQLDQALDAAGLSMRPGEFVMLTGIAIVIMSMLASLAFDLVGAVVVVLLAIAVVCAVIQVRTNRRRTAFADQLTDTLTIITGSLRAGRGLPQALELVATEATSPTREEFQRVVTETRIGRDMNDAMAELGERMKCDDLNWVNRAMAINRQLGGDLVEVLDKVADTIRDRRRVARQVRALSAEGRATGWVLLALPVLMFVYLRTANPEYAGLLTSTTPGLLALTFGLIAWIVGGIWIRRLVNIRY